ncbi:MAG TPA: carbohydrate porin [Usitatibacter sp.]|nr:carbohydrate porin [Usitatibacter sp.]
MFDSLMPMLRPAAALLVIVAAASRVHAADDAHAALFKPALVYDGAAFTSLGGGAERGSTYSSNLHLQLTVDPSRYDTIGYVDALWLTGGNPSRYVGDAQGVSSISGPAAAKIYEAWIQTNSPGNHASFLVGLYDLNTEFYRLQSSALFFNASFGIGPEFAQSGVAGPSIFPDTSLGLRAAAKPIEGCVLRMAVLDGVPFERPDGGHHPFASGDGVLVVGEVAFLDRARESMRPANGKLRLGRNAQLGNYDTKLAFGAWRYTGTFADLSETDAAGRPTMHHGSSGFYAIGDRMLYRRGDDGTRVNGFVQAGVGDARVNRFGSYLGAGITVAGLVPARADDEAGLAVAYARNGSHYLASLPPGTATNAETAIELTYLVQATSWLAVQPDLQYVVHPGTSTAIPNAWAFQVRFESSF